MRMRKTTFSFFLALTLTSLFSFCWNGLLFLGLTKSNFFSFSLTCFIYLACLLKKFLDFLILSLLAHHMSYLQLYCFFLTCPITGVNYRREHLHHTDLYAESQHFIFTVLNICYYIIFPCSLPVVRPTPFRLANKVDKKSMEDWDPR